MKRITLFILTALAANLPAQSSGPCTLDWSTVDGGGTTFAGTGGNYTLSGTIGQPDAAAPLTGGPFSLSGGFWAVAAIQTQDAPTLRLQLAPGLLAVLTWPDDGTVWHLESSPDLEMWTPVSGQPQLSGSEYSVTVSAGSSRLFFRLKRAP